MMPQRNVLQLHQLRVAKIDFLMQNKHIKTTPTQQMHIIYNEGPGGE